MDSAESLEELLGELDPKSILVLGQLGEHLIDDYVSDHLDCKLARADPEHVLEQLDSLARYDLVFVSHTIEYMAADRAIQLIARLRDIHARRLILVVAMGEQWPGSISVWNKRDLLALGLVQIAENIVSDRLVHVYGYDILTYKTSPDWLSSRFWANPGLFDKYWW